MIASKYILRELLYKTQESNSRTSITNFILLIKCYSPLWTLTSVTVFLHSWSFLAIACLFFIPIIFKFSLTLYLHLVCSLRLSIVLCIANFTHICGKSLFFFVCQIALLVYWLVELIVALTNYKHCWQLQVIWFYEVIKVNNVDFLKWNQFFSITDAFLNFL